MGLFASAATLLLAGVLHGAGADRSCPGEVSLIDAIGQGRDLLDLAGSEYQVVYYEELQDCLQRLTVPADIAYHTIMHLEHGIGDVYSYTQLAKSSGASDQKVSSGCSLEVHESEVDLQGGLDDLKRRLIAEADAGGAESTPADFESLRTCGASFPAQEFHQRLSELFRTLFDAHTVYMSPVAQLAPAYIFGEWGSRLVFEIVQSERYDPISGSGVDWTVLLVRRLDETDWHTVESVAAGGRTFAPLEWLQEWADKGLGHYRSRGARLNALYSSLATGAFEAEPPRGPLPSDVVIELLGDSPLTVPLRALMLNKDVEDMQDIINSNPRWTAVRAWLDANLNLQGPQQRAAMEQALAKARAGAALRQRLAPAPEVLRALRKRLAAEAGPRADEAGGGGLASGLRGDARGEPLVARRRLVAGGVTAIGEIRGAQGEIVVKAYSVSGAVVFKVHTFAPSNFGDQFLKDLAELYRQTVDAGWKHGRLILDLSDNGGGVVEYANLLTYLISPQHHTPEELCSQYRVAVSDFWGKWIESFGGRWNMLLKHAEQLGAEDIRDRLIRLRSILRLGTEIGAVPPLSENVVEELTHNAENFDEATLKKQWKKLLNRKDEILTSFQGLGRPTVQSLTGEDTESGWFPFTGDVKDPHTESTFHPPAEPFLHTEEHKWGARSAKYSQRYLFACDLVFHPTVSDMLHLPESKWQWKEVAVLTNGLCGSACSLIATKLQFAEGATVFTYGGMPGEECTATGCPPQEPMDHSAFAGGNVEQYKDFWPNVLYAALVGDILWGPDTPIGRLLREPGAKRHHWANSLLLPLPSTAVTTFNFNMMHIKELGPEALPREWYNIPAHKNYEVWLAGGTQSGTDGQQELYKQISSEDWGALREAKVAQYGCARDPPPWDGTKSPDRSFVDWSDAAPYLVILMVNVCVCCCCCGCVAAICWGLCYGCYMMCRKPTASAAMQRNAVDEAQRQPGTEMPTLPHAQGAAATVATVGG